MERWTTSLGPEETQWGQEKENDSWVEGVKKKKEYFYEKKSQMGMRGWKSEVGARVLAIVETDSRRE